jgi:hypothetical protein
VISRPFARLPDGSLTPNMALLTCFAAGGVCAVSLAHLFQGEDGPAGTISAALMALAAFATYYQVVDYVGRNWT